MDRIICIPRELVTTRSLELVDCSKHPEHPGILSYVCGLNVNNIDKPISLQKSNEITWASIDYAFARPVTRNDEYIDYVPTQIIADLFRHLNFDGLVYKSKLNADGYNIALFDPNSTEIIGCELFKLKNLTFEFEEEVGSAAKWGKTTPYRKQNRSD